MNRKLSILAILTLTVFLWVQACGPKATPTPEAPPTVIIPPALLTNSNASLTVADVPIPSNYYNYVVNGTSSLSFLTSMTVEDMKAFFEDKLPGYGYTLRKDGNSEESKGFTMIWDGHRSGQALVFQVTDMENGSTSVFIRLEAR